MWRENVLCLLLVLQQEGLVSWQKLDLCVEGIEISILLRPV